MSLAQELLRQHASLVQRAVRSGIQGPPRPRYGRIAEKPVEFEYTYGYGARRRGSKRTLTWLIPLAQLKTFCRESHPGDHTVWPYVSTEEQMIRRQTTRVHHMARENGWKIKTSRRVTGLKVIYCGARVR